MFYSFKIAINVSLFGRRGAAKVKVISVAIRKLFLISSASFENLVSKLISAVLIASVSPALNFRLSR